MLVSSKKYKLLQKENEELKSELEDVKREEEINNEYIGYLERENKEYKEDADRLKDKNIELTTKNASNIYEIEELKEKVSKLEFENKDLKSKRSSTEIMKKQILNMCIYRDKKGKMVKIRDGEILVNEKISGVKIWDLVNLM